MDTHTFGGEEERGVRTLNSHSTVRMKRWSRKVQHQLLLVNKEVNSRKLKKKKELRDGCLYVAGIGVEIGEKEITVFHFKAYNI